MKKIWIFLILAVIALAGCGSDEPAKSKAAAENVSVAAAENPSSGGRILIAYFSRYGNTQYSGDVDASTSASVVTAQQEKYGTTEFVARLIQQNVDGDMYLIQTQKQYPEDFQTLVVQNHEEMNDDYFPALKDSNLNMNDYDTIYLGYPIWATDAPQAIFSFLRQYDLSGKKIALFCTHDGYGSGSSYEDIKKAVPNSEFIGELDIEAQDVPFAQNIVREWLKKIHMIQEANSVPITVNVDGKQLTGVLYNTALAEEIKDCFPLTVSMTGFGGREYYGKIEQVPVNAGKGQLNFKNGDITYCKTNNTLAIFYAQTDRPDLTMEVIPIGKVTSDLSVFDELPRNVDITFSLAQ